MTKACTQCGETKDLSMFYANTRMRDGHCSHCKACQLKMTRDYQNRNRSKVNAWHKNWAENNADKLHLSKMKYRLKKKGVPPSVQIEQELQRLATLKAAQLKLKHKHDELERSINRLRADAYYCKPVKNTIIHEFNRPKHWEVYRTIKRGR